jgi:serine/threonine protein kinase
MESLKGWERDLSNDFELLECIHHGKYTKVWLVRERLKYGQKGEYMVIKHYRVRMEAIMEIGCLKKLQSSKYFPKCWSELRQTSNESRLLGIEYVDGEPFSPRNSQEMRKQLFHVFNALNIMHKFGIVHRDLKDEHILVNKITGMVKLIDFGLSKPEGRATAHDGTSYTGTWPYVAPEEVKGDAFTCAVDMWSMGIIIARVIIGPEVFFHLMGKKNLIHLHTFSDEIHTKTNLWFNKAQLRKNIFDNDLWNLMSNLLLLNPQDRPKAKETLQHNFFSSLLNVDL